MKTKLIKNSERTSNLIVYFAGWGTPPSAVSHLVLPENTDLLICYDYRDFNLDIDFSMYQQVRLVAWSMGVWVANQVMQNVSLISATAINGTSFPCDDEMGIPRAVFKGTLEQLDEQNLVKFQRRMCGDSRTFQYYQQLADLRECDVLRTELSALYEGIQQDQGKTIIWTRAILGEGDRIFPMKNQKNYWQVYQMEQRSPCKRVREFLLEIAPLSHYPFLAFRHWNELF